uniref:Apolipoprotein M n=1 Tax=Neolamprologus brichardi TaxID=32507 RepID=A0A3Q4I5S8_NEOBR
MLAACAVVLLWLMPVSYSTLLACEELVRPLNDLDPRHLEGRWALLAGSFSDPAHLKFFKLRDTSTLSYTQINRFGHQCQYLQYNISAEGSSFTFDVQSRFSLSMYFLHTSCPDCVVMRWLVKSSRRISVDLYLLSRRREVEQKELEEFRAQLKCYQLPEPVVMDPTKELCPEQPENQPTAAAAPQAEETVAQKA